MKERERKKTDKKKDGEKERKKKLTFLCRASVNTRAKCLLSLL